MTELLWYHLFFFIIDRQNVWIIQGCYQLLNHTNLIIGYATFSLAETLFYLLTVKTYFLKNRIIVQFKLPKTILGAIT